MPNRRIAAAGNTVVPALLALEHLGFDVNVHNSSTGQTVVAVRGGEEYMADDAVAVLGLVKLIEVRQWPWNATDEEIEAALRRYHLDGYPTL